MLVVATIPATLAGFLFADFIEDNLRTLWVICITSFVFALLLWFADYNDTREMTYEFISTRPKLKNIYSLIDTNYMTFFIIGCGQILALIPGVSRSGVVITFAMLLGYGRSEATRIAFLMAIPIGCMAFLYGLLQYSSNTQVALETELTSLVMVFAVAFVVTLVSAKAFLQFVDRIGMMPFVIYRILLALVIAFYILWFV